MKYKYLPPEEGVTYKIPLDTLDTLIDNPTGSQLMIWYFAIHFFCHRHTTNFGCLKCKGRTGVKVVGIFERDGHTFYAEVLKNEVRIRAIYNYKYVMI